MHQLDRIIVVFRSLLLISLFSVISVVATSQSERDIAIEIQKTLGGTLEYITADKSRVDLLTSTYAYEIDFAPKWKDSIGQALWYAIQTNKKAGIIIIVQYESDFNSVQKLQSTIEFNGLSSVIDVKVYPDDFDQSVQFSHQDNRHSKKHYWLSANSNVRHNDQCRWFEKSRGGFCSHSEGSPGGCCGG